MTSSHWQVVEVSINPESLNRFSEPHSKRRRAGRHQEHSPKGSVRVASYDARREMSITLAGPGPSDQAISNWLSAAVLEAEGSEDEVPTGEVVEEARRIITKLRDSLPDDTDVYPMDKGEIALSVFGRSGNAYLLVLEPDGGALCIVTVDGVSRRARYQTSARLPDNFLKDGLDEVRPAAKYSFPEPTSYPCP